MRMASISVVGRPAESTEEMRAVVEAIERRDGAAAARLSVEHVERAARTLLGSPQLSGSWEEDAGI